MTPNPSEDIVTADGILNQLPLYSRIKTFYYKLSVALGNQIMHMENHLLISSVVGKLLGYFCRGRIGPLGLETFLSFFALGWKRVGSAKL